MSQLPVCRLYDIVTVVLRDINASASDRADDRRVGRLRACMSELAACLTHDDTSVWEVARAPVK